MDHQPQSSSYSPQGDSVSMRLLGIEEKLNLVVHNSSKVESQTNQLSIHDLELGK